MFEENWCTSLLISELILSPSHTAFLRRRIFLSEWPPQVFHLFFLRLIYSCRTKVKPLGKRKALAAATTAGYFYTCLRLSECRSVLCLAFLNKHETARFLNIHWLIHFVRHRPDTSLFDCRLQKEKRYARLNFHNRKE